MAQVQQAADARAAAQSRVRLELLTELVRKDLKVKYKNSALGFVWSMANPLLYLAVFTLVFTFFLPNGVPRFAVLFMAGFLVWSFFSLDAIITALIATRILEQFVAQVFAVVLLRNLRQEVVRAWKMWLYPLPCAVRFTRWG